MKKHSTLSFAAGLALACLFSCEDTSPPLPCVDMIPPGGCPTSSADDVCMDPACLNAYDCVAGKWKLNHACPPKPLVDGGPDAMLTPFDAAGFDAPPGAFGGPGCPDLQLPDCPVGIAIACSSQDCCGCGDLFVCMGGGWTAWGTCSADGGVRAGG